MRAAPNTTLRIVGALIVAAWSAVATATVDGPRPADHLRLGHDARVVVFAPHPDDETIGAGGLIRRLVREHASVQVVFMTSGDGYPDAVRAALHGRAPHASDYLAYGRQREREALAAAHRLGVPPDAVHFLGFPDGGLDALWESHWSDNRPYTSPFTARSRPPYSGVFDPGLLYDGESLIIAISRVVLAERPTLVVIPHPDDVHPDHAATARFVVEALDRLRGHHQLPHTVELLAYLVHDPLWPPRASETAALPPPGRIQDTEWIALPLTPDEQAAKATALRAYGSQLAFMSDLLERFLRPNELFGRVDPALLARIAARH
jgi:LmbE family N-acetylglucosaminyl deacetylase